MRTITHTLGRRTLPGTADFQQRLAQRGGWGSMLTCDQRGKGRLGQLTCDQRGGWGSSHVTEGRLGQLTCDQRGSWGSSHVTEGRLGQLTCDRGAAGAAHM
eukprot:352678-Chlamydomonas_euryale.AAC.1